jgi:hypothetical protein
MNTRHWHCGSLGTQRDLFNLDWDFSSWRLGLEWDALGVFVQVLCFTVTYWRRECRDLMNTPDELLQKDLWM